MEILMPSDRIIDEMRIKSAFRRKIYLCEEIDRESIFKVIYYLDRLKEIDEKSGTKEPIEIVLDTYGGDAYSTIALCSKMRSMIMNDGYKIITTAHTIAFSGGFWILISGSERRALPDSRIMVHSAISGTSGKHQDMLDDMDETMTIWNKLKSIITDNTNISDMRLEEIKKMKYDWYFWGSDAVKEEFNIVDKIL